MQPDESVHTVPTLQHEEAAHTNGISTPLMSINELELFEVSN